MKWFLKLLLSALAVFLLANILPGVVVESYMYAIWVAVIIGVLNAFLRPVLIFFTLPATLVTLGLFLFVINACIILIASNILSGLKWIFGSLLSIIHARFSGASVFHFHIFYFNILIVLNLLLVKWHLKLKIILIMDYYLIKYQFQEKILI